MSGVTRRNRRVRPPSPAAPPYVFSTTGMFASTPFLYFRYLNSTEYRGIVYRGISKPADGKKQRRASARRLAQLVIEWTGGACLFLIIRCNASRGLARAENDAVKCGLWISYGNQEYLRKRSSSYQCQNWPSADMESCKHFLSRKYRMLEIISILSNNND